MHTLDPCSTGRIVQTFLLFYKCAATGGMRMMELRNILVLAVALAACAVARAKVHILTDDNFDSFVDHVPDDALLLVDFFTVSWVDTLVYYTVSHVGV